MRTFLTSKLGLLTATAVLLVGSGIAYAYWTAGGSGSGSAATGTNVPITAVQTSVVSAMGPGDSPQALSGNFDNSNSGAVLVTSVTASISTVVKAGGAAAGVCSAADYTLANAVMTVNAEVPTGNAQGSWSGATIKFNNTGSNQDQCKGATVNLAYAIS